MAPLALRAPRILLGSAWKIWLRATEVALGCLKLTVPSADMLKLRQLRMASCEVCLTVSVLPACTAVAVPAPTHVMAWPPQLPATQGMGSSAGTAGGAAQSEAAPTAIQENCMRGMAITSGLKLRTHNG